MQKDVDSVATPVPIRFLGVNEAGLESGNPEICNGRTLAWLQDVPSVKAWDLWHVTFRDVVVLDQNNQVAFIYNLSTYDLADSANYAELKRRVLETAGAVTRSSRWNSRPELRAPAPLASDSARCN